MSGFGGHGGGGAPRVRKVMTQAINLIFEYLKNVSFTNIRGYTAASTYLTPSTFDQF